MTQIMSPATGRHIRSPGSLRRAGPGLPASMKNGSAVGAIYPYLKLLLSPLQPHFAELELKLNEQHFATITYQSSIFKQNTLPPLFMNS